MRAHKRTPRNTSHNPIQQVFPTLKTSQVFEKMFNKTRVFLRESTRHVRCDVTIRRRPKRMVGWQGLGVDHIQIRTGKATVLQRIDQSDLIDRCAAADVVETRRRLHPTNALSIKELDGAGRLWKNIHDVIRFTQRDFEIVDTRIKGNHFDSLITANLPACTSNHCFMRTQHFDQPLADAAKADDQDPLISENLSTGSHLGVLPLALGLRPHGFRHGSS